MERRDFLQRIVAEFEIHPICAILGPHQVGKATLAKLFARDYFSDNMAFFDLENPEDLARLEEPLLTLSRLTDRLIIIDEVQRKPDLFPILRVLADAPEKNQKFLILGSASRDLLRQSSESLAGRIGYLELTPFSLSEVKQSEKLWLRGGFPRSFLAQTDAASYAWRKGYLITFLETDIPALGFSIPPEHLRRFWLMLAHYHGQIFNASELGRSLGISGHTVRSYLDILAGTFMVRILTPWFENLNKRQVKSPKIYLRDSGILHALVGIQDDEQLHIYPKLGAFWEGFAMEEVIRSFGAPKEDCYFWATQADAELDLLLLQNGKRLGFEFKYTDAPRPTKSIHIAYNDLKLDHVTILYPGKNIFPLTDYCTAVGLENLTKDDTWDFLKNTKHKPL